jgi:hypothetical protein
VDVRIRELAELEGSDVGLESEVSRGCSAGGSELRRTRLGIPSQKRRDYDEASISVVWDLYDFSTIVC